MSFQAMLFGVTNGIEKTRSLLLQGAQQALLCRRFLSRDSNIMYSRTAG